MTDSDKDSGNQPKQWSPEDWRLLMITFVGGLASILGGAAMLGLAIILARKEQPGNNTFSWIFLVGGPLILVGIVVALARERREGWFQRIAWSFMIGIIIVVALTWIGVAAGIK
jgi:drug/metabolite transporter (DMT)-like permease